MGVFVILLLVPIVLQYIAVNEHSLNHAKRNQRALTFFFFWLTVLVMFRHESIGSDTDNYIYFFNRFTQISWADIGKSGLEYGFVAYNKIISLFSTEPQFFFAITAILTILMIYPTYKRLCVDASLTIVLFCFMSTFVLMFSGIRQMMAVGIGFIAYECTRKKKLLPFILLVFFAMSFHTSAFMLAFMYPLYHVKITKKRSLMLVPIFGVVFAFNKQIFTSFGTILEQYTKYDATITQTGAYTVLILFGIFAIFAFLIPDESRLDKETLALRNFLLFSIILQMFAPLHTIAMRMNYYYIIFIPLLLPRIIAYRNIQWGEIAIAARYIMLVFFLIYFFINASGGGALHVFPYHFFWENV